MATLVSPGPVLMENVTWTGYVTFCDELEDGSATRMIFDNGRLQIMTLSREHELVKTVTGRLLEYWATEKDWPLSGFGQVTLRRRDLLVGLEPDECYYIQTPAPPPTRGEFDLKAFPPPDLAIEVEVSRPAIDKISIYGRLGVGEVWRWTGDHFVVLVRQADGHYTEQAASRCLPDLPMTELADFVRHALSEGQPAAMRRLRDRLRGQS